MELNEKIENDFKEALKKKDETSVSTLRMLKSAMHNREIEKKGEKLQDAEIIKIIEKQVRQHQDSIEYFKQGKRDELVEKETKELEILKSYLPKQMPQEEITTIVKKIIEEASRQEKLDFGKAMKLVMAELKGKADAKLISQIVEVQLQDKNK